MATRFSHTATFSASPADVHAAYSDEAYWKDRIANIGGPDDTLDSFSSGPDGIEVTVTQVIPDKDIPDLARKVLPDRLAIVRTTTYGPLEGDSFTGTAHAEAVGGLGVIDGSGECTVSGDGATETVSGSAKVSVPLLGGKLEKLVVQYLEKLFVAEYEHLDTWASSH